MCPSKPVFGNTIIPMQLRNIDWVQVNGTRKLLDFMLDNLGVPTSPPPPRPWMQLAPLDRKTSDHF